MDCPGMSQDIICTYTYVYPIKRGWSLAMHSAPPPLLMGRGCGCSSLTSSQIGDTGHPKTVCGIPRRITQRFNENVFSTIL